jgi:hypothetical protein
MMQIEYIMLNDSDFDPQATLIGPASAIASNPGALLCRLYFSCRACLALTYTDKSYMTISWHNSMCIAGLASVIKN